MTFISVIYDVHLFSQVATLSQTGSQRLIRNVAERKAPSAIVHDHPLTPANMGILGERPAQITIKGSKNCNLWISTRIPFPQKYHVYWLDEKIFTNPNFACPITRVRLMMVFREDSRIALVHLISSTLSSQLMLTSCQVLAVSQHSVACSPPFHYSVSRGQSPLSKTEHHSCKDTSIVSQLQHVRNQDLPLAVNPKSPDSIPSEKFLWQSVNFCPASHFSGHNLGDADGNPADVCAFGGRRSFSIAFESFLLPTHTVTLEWIEILCVLCLKEMQGFVPHEFGTIYKIYGSTSPSILKNLVQDGPKYLVLPKKWQTKNRKRRSLNFGGFSCLGSQGTMVFFLWIPNI